ncbi:hypothetical protein HMPREF1531_00818 [Propionibacterium sp. oral taxon 192 str. F0372]|uniref:sugar phosphate isomerase/epimerase family protein n=1 Tax=Propionibacterium sp. oral taxon 192 TaxID=671222 RepID=UPI0003542193|nr:sugar phosphate isomerase/epimerase family protein [Propionibacterium sp. oral taxon 192]EPH06169.1 hypothetical protein HMPREF1531_00818 [Propionibacterium sp. oral taxon 192 str. F0372]
MIQLAYNLNGLRSMPLNEACTRVADVGFAGVELSLHPSHLDPFSCRTRDLVELRRVAGDLGLKIPSLAAGADNLLSSQRFEPSLVSPSADGRRQRLELLRRAIVIAEELQIPNLNFATGILNPEISRSVAFEWLMEGLGQLLELSETVTLIMEPEPGFFLQRNAEVADLIEEIGHPRFRLAQDLGHTRVVDNDYLSSVREYLDVSPVIQVEDIKGRVHNHEIPGDGDIDWTAFADLLADAGWSGWLSVELYNQEDRLDDALRRSFEILQSVVVR